MKTLILISSIIMMTGCATIPYVKVGAGLKFQEQINRYCNSKLQCNGSSPLTARIEAGIHQGSWSYGVSHHSQWLVGFPFNDDKEYSKTELFVDYEWQF